MALFGPADRNLPDLTQFVQLEPHELEPYYAMNKLPFDQAETAREILQRTKEIMSTLAEHKAITRDQYLWAWNYLQLLGSTFDEPSWRETYRPENRVEIWYSGDPTLVSGVRRVPTFTDPLDFITGGIINQLATIIDDVTSKGLDKIRVCPECHNPFVVTRLRPVQVYCSRRCNARAGERRRYAEKKASLR